MCVYLRMSHIHNYTTAIRARFQKIAAIFFGINQYLDQLIRTFYYDFGSFYNFLDRINLLPIDCVSIVCVCVCLVF